MLQLTIDEIREYSKYTKGEWPPTDPKYGDPVAYRKPAAGEFYYGRDSQRVVVAQTNNNSYKQLIYAEPEPKYRFVTDGVERLGERGDWVFRDKTRRWHQLAAPETFKRLIFEREEVTNG